MVVLSMNKNNFIRLVENKLNQQYVINRLINLERVQKLLRNLENEKNNDEIKNIMESIIFEFQASNLNL